MIRRFLTNVRIKLDTLSKSDSLFIAFLLICLAGVLDHMTGPHFSFSIFYLIPISFSAWFAGRRAAVLTSFASGTVWFAVDWINTDQQFHVMIYLWNGGVRLGFFLIVSYMLTELKSTNETLKRSVERISQFSGNLAHELRTPINNLAGEAEVALSRDRTTDEYKEVLESSLEEYVRLSHMIDSLLFLARAENPETTIDRKTFDAALGVQKVQDFYDAMAEEKNITVTCDGKATLHADPMLFSRALSNLFGNSLKHTPAGGKICVQIQPADASVAIIVSDTGKGISSEHLSKIFDRFYRVADPQSDHGGAGLGLAIVQSIMDLHKGEVHIQSEPNRGTTVTLKFPS
jgi:signal transduction histidine kinase